MKHIAEKPFENYYLYSITLDKIEKRRYVCLLPIDKTTHKGRRISYARYLMGIHLGKEVESSLTVDHIDNNKLNDNISNLQLLSMEDNKKKYHNTLECKYAKLKCPVCNIIFERPYRQIHIQKGGKFTTCSRKCSGTLRNNLKLSVYTDSDISKMKIENIQNLFMKPFKDRIKI